MEITGRRPHAPDPSSSFLHIGAWCEEIPPTAYIPSLQVPNRNIEEHHEQETKLETFQITAQSVSKTKRVTRSRRTGKSKAETDTLPRYNGLDLDSNMKEAIKKLPAPMTQRWLMETTPEEPWLVIEASQDAHISYNVQIEEDNNRHAEGYRASNASAVYNGSPSPSHHNV